MLLFGPGINSNYLCWLPGVLFSLLWWNPYQPPLGDDSCPLPQRVSRIKSIKTPSLDLILAAEVSQTLPTLWAPHRSLHSWTSRCALIKGTGKLCLLQPWRYALIADFLGVEIKLIADLHKGRYVCMNASIPNGFACWETRTGMEKLYKMCVVSLPGRVVQFALQHVWHALPKRCDVTPISKHSSLIT